MMGNNESKFWCTKVKLKQLHIDKEESEQRQEESRRLVNAYMDKCTVQNGMRQWNQNVDAPTTYDRKSICRNESHPNISEKRTNNPRIYVATCKLRIKWHATWDARWNSYQTSGSGNGCSDNGDEWEKLHGLLPRVLGPRKKNNDLCEKQHVFSSDVV